MKKAMKRVLFGLAALVLAAMVLAGCAPAADSPPPNSGASLTAASTLGGAAISALGEQTGADETNAVTATVVVPHAQRTTAAFAAAFAAGSGGAAVTAVANTGSTGGAYDALTGYDFSTANTTLWVQVVSADGSATTYYKISVTVGAPVITTSKTALLAADTGITITGSGFKTTATTSDFTIAGAQLAKVTGIATDPAPTTTSVTFTVSGLATADIFSITAKTSAFDPAASAASNTLNFAVPDAAWTTSHTLTAANVAGETTFANVKFYKVTSLPSLPLTIITTKAEIDAALGAPVTSISAADAGKTLAAAEYDANNFIKKSGYVVLAGVQATDTGADIITLEAVTDVPPVSAALAGASKTIAASIGTALTTDNTLTVNLTNAVVKEALASTNVASWFSGSPATVTGLTYRASAAANATSITVTIGGAASAAQTTTPTVTIPATALKYVNGTAYASTLGVTGSLTISADFTPNGKTYYLMDDGIHKTVFSPVASGTVTSGTYTTTFYQQNQGGGSYSTDYVEIEKGGYSWNAGTSEITLTPTQARDSHHNDQGGLTFGSLKTKEQMTAAMLADIPVDELPLAGINEELGTNFASLDAFYTFASEYFGKTISNWAQFRAAYASEMADYYFKVITYGYSFSDDKAALFLDEPLPTNKGDNELNGKSGTRNGYTISFTSTTAYTATNGGDAIAGTYAYDTSTSSVYLKPTTVGSKTRAAYYAAKSSGEGGSPFTRAQLAAAETNNAFAINNDSYTINETTVSFD